jgi:hypothetical protein
LFRFAKRLITDHRFDYRFYEMRTLLPRESTAALRLPFEA